MRNLAEISGLHSGVRMASRISESTVNAMIRTWRLARSRCDQGKLDYPRISILHPEHGVSDDSDTPESNDADVIQGIVEKMPGHIRVTFEAFHLGIIRGQYCRNKPHKWRWIALGLEKWAYDDRERAGWGIINEYLTYSGVLVD